MPLSSARGMKIQEVCEVLNVSRATVYRLQKEDEGFPKGKQFTRGLVRWDRDEINQWALEKIKS